jgi:IS4 transposase
MLACWIHDALEREPPPAGRYAVSDGWQTATLDTLSRGARSRYRSSFADQFERLRATMGRLAIPLLPIVTGADAASSLRRGVPVETRQAAPS